MEALTIDSQEITWTDFRRIVEESVKDGTAGNFIYRGSCDSSFKLKTSLHRTGQLSTPQDMSSYIEIVLPFASQFVSAWDGKSRDLKNPFQLAEFIAYLQHHGFPTPLLDWSKSPYIASFFAFRGVAHYEPEVEHVAVYRFDSKAWLKDFKQIYDYKDGNLHVSIMEPSFVGNNRQLLQQGVFMFTNVPDIEDHVALNEKGKQKTYLSKFVLSVKERKVAMSELNLMNVNAMQLFPGLEGICEKLANDVALLSPVGKTRPEKLREFLNQLQLKPPAEGGDQSSPSDPPIGA